MWFVTVTMKIKMLRVEVDGVNTWRFPASGISVWSPTYPRVRFIAILSGWATIHSLLLHTAYPIFLEVRVYNTGWPI
jgi:hypothetical protein